MDKKDAIKLACAYFDYKWPKEISTGVIFYDGHRITLEEFLEWAIKFKEATGDYRGMK